MITNLSIANFKAAASVTVPLGPITVLIGPNDSGKSTILQALMALSRTIGARHAKPDQLFDCPLSIAVTNQDLSRNINIAATGRTYLSDTQRLHTYKYEIQISSESEKLNKETAYWDDEQILSATRGGPLLVQAKRRIESWSGDNITLQFYRPEPTEHSHGLNHYSNFAFQNISEDLGAILLRLDARAIAKPSSLEAKLLPDGSGLVAIADEMLTSGIGDEKIAKTNAILQKLTPHIKGIAARRHNSGGKELHFALRNGTVVPASEISDGIVLAAALVLISLGVNTPRLLIEEPENGLHPRQLRIVADTIRSIATEHGTQIVLTTHSPLLLNFFSAEETLLVTRSESGVSVQPMDKAKGFAELAHEMSLGELWYNVGDSDLARPA